MTSSQKYNDLTIFLVFLCKIILFDAMEQGNISDINGHAFPIIHDFQIVTAFDF